MARYKIWDKKSDIYTPAGPKFTAQEWLAMYQWAALPDAKVVISGGKINGALIDDFDNMVQRYKAAGGEIKDGMSDDEILAAIEDFENNPPGSDEPSIEERTAAALEFIALNSLPDEN